MTGALNGVTANVEIARHWRIEAGYLIQNNTVRTKIA